MTFPAALDLRAKRCVVVGSGQEALRRVTQFQREGADVHWITQGAAETMQGIVIAQRDFTASDLEQAWIVVLADQDARLASEIGTLCSQQRVFFCAIDQPTHNSFSHMARVDAPPLIVAISTSGQVPGLAGRMRDLLANLFTPSVVDYFKQLVLLRAAESDRETRKRKVKAAVAAIELSGQFEIAPSKEDL